MIITISKSSMKKRDDWPFWSLYPQVLLERRKLDAGAPPSIMVIIVGLYGSLIPSTIVEIVYCVAFGRLDTNGHERQGLKSPDWRDREAVGISAPVVWRGIPTQCYLNINRRYENVKNIIINVIHLLLWLINRLRFYGHSPSRVGQMSCGDLLAPWDKWSPNIIGRQEEGEPEDWVLLWQMPIEGSKSPRLRLQWSDTPCHSGVLSRCTRTFELSMAGLRLTLMFQPEQRLFHTDLHMPHWKAGSTSIWRICRPVLLWGWRVDRGELAHSQDPAQMDDVEGSSHLYHWAFEMKTSCYKRTV